MSSLPFEPLTPPVQFVEDLAQLLEVNGGLPPIAGRIFATLLITDAPYLSGPELAETLQISSGSVSTMTRLLETLNFIERISRPRVRANLYRVGVQHWEATIAQASRTSERYRDLAQRMLAETNSELVTGRLTDYAEFHDTLATLLRRLADDWIARPGRQL